MKKRMCLIHSNVELLSKKAHNGIMGPGGKVWVEYFYCPNCGLMYSPLQKKKNNES